MRIRELVFWCRPFAQGVVGVLKVNLPEGVALLPLHLWRLLPPCTSSHSSVWWVVCLCALGAMRRARSLVEGEGMVGLESCVQEHLKEGLFLKVLDFIASHESSSTRQVQKHHLEAYPRWGTSLFKPPLVTP